MGQPDLPGSSTSTGTPHSDLSQIKALQGVRSQCKTLLCSADYSAALLTGCKHCRNTHHFSRLGKYSYRHYPWLHSGGMICKQVRTFFRLPCGTHGSTWEHSSMQGPPHWGWAGKCGKRTGAVFFRFGGLHATKEHIPPSRLQQVKHLKRSILCSTSKLLLLSYVNQPLDDRPTACVYHKYGRIVVMLSRQPFGGQQAFGETKCRVTEETTCYFTG